MSELKNDRFLRALLRQPVDRTPVWMMRQAGRYLPEYRATRQQAGSFLDLCKNAELACEVTMQPLRRYPMDAAILFSDILTVPDALGLGLYFEEGEGPRFRKTVRSAEDLAGLNTIRADDDLSYVMDAVRLIRREFRGRVPLIGFAGARVAAGTTGDELPEGFQRSEFLLRKGALDMIVDRRQLRPTIARALAMLQRQNADAVA